MSYLFAALAVAAMASAHGKASRRPTVIINNRRYAIVGVDDAINGPTTTLKEVK